MGALTEPEIFDCMRTNLRIAIDCCDKLAARPTGNVHYDGLRKALRLIEGCCKQACVWREDTRWLNIGKLMAAVHEHAGEWLRGIKQEDGSRIKIATGELHPAFAMLAENLKALMRLAEQIRFAATHRSGMILPEVLEGPHRDTRPVGWNKSDSGILLPAGAGMQ